MPRVALISTMAIFAVVMFLQATAFALPDAAIARITAIGSDIREGDQVSIKIEVVNRGSSPLPPIPVILSINDKQYAEWKAPTTLAPQDKATWSLILTAVRGSVVLLATADPLNDVIESDESNNTGFISLGVGEVRPPSIWPPTLAGLGAFILGFIIAFVFQRLRPKPRPEQRYAIRPPARTELKPTTPPPSKK